MTSRSLGHRAPLLWLVLPEAAGLAAGRVTAPVPVPWLLAGAVMFALLAVAAARRRPFAWAMALAGALALAGWASYALHRPRLADWDRLPPRELRLALRVFRVFPQADARKTTGLALVTKAGSRWRELSGQRVYFSLLLPRGQPAPMRSAEIDAVGILAPAPRDSVAGSFDRYLDDAGVNFRFARGRLLAVEHPPTRYRAFCERLAARLETILGLGIAGKRPDLTAIYRAMMLGQKHELSDEQDALFLRSGTLHLFAINGLHIGVVAVALAALLAALRCPRPAVALVTLGVLWLDVDTTGASPSAVRAFLLVACHELAPVLRRPANGLASLSLAALLVLTLDPLALFSASFQMSYGVVAVILAFGLPLGEKLEAAGKPFRDLPTVTWPRWRHWVAGGSRWLAGALGLGTAATLVSAITGATFFQVFTPAALAMNLVLMPLASLVIIAGFASIVTGLTGAVVPSILFNHAAALVLAVIDRFVRLGAGIPGAWWAVEWRAGWIAPVTYATLLAVVFAGYAGGWRGKFGGFWPPFVVAALALIAGVRFAS
ncbi:MAG TPA: ComEC/Rec2 family competence protein [Opitutaceae bacterium]|nr:ComEC/Rec2 family competence protein [Opitutaceae bacterium]